MKLFWLVGLLLLVTACDRSGDGPSADPDDGVPSGAHSDSDISSAPALEPQPSKRYVFKFAKDVDVETVSIVEEVARIRTLMIERTNPTYVPYIQQLIEAQPDSEDLAAAYGFVARFAMGPERGEAADVMFEKYVDSIEMKDLFDSLVSEKASPQHEQRIQALLESPHPEVRGMALYAKAQYFGIIPKKIKMVELSSEYRHQLGDLDYLKSREVEPQAIIEMYETIIRDYASVEVNGEKLGDQAARHLAELKSETIDQQGQ